MFHSECAQLFDILLHSAVEQLETSPYSQRLHSTHILKRNDWKSKSTQSLFIMFETVLNDKTVKNEKQENAHVMFLTLHIKLSELQPQSGTF